MKQIVVFDIDGTIADCQHRLHYIQQDKPDWDAFYLACGNDKPIDEMLDLLNAIQNYGGFCIKLVTGRSEICRRQTLFWLDQQSINIHGDNLLMRGEKDYRQDAVLKWELVQDFKDDIAFVLEDRNQVVEMWRDKGIRCLQVAEGDF